MTPTKEWRAHFYFTRRRRRLRMIRELLDSAFEQFEDSAAAAHKRPGDPAGGSAQFALPRIPEAQTQGCDHSVVDDGYFLKFMSTREKSVDCGDDGRSVGIVANQPAFLAGVLRYQRVREGARFVRFARLHIPLITFEMCQDFFRTQQDLVGLFVTARSCVRVCEATVPKIT